MEQKNDEQNNGGRGKYLTVKEIANRYRTSEAMIYRWVNNGTIPVDVVLRLGVKILINQGKLEAFESSVGDLNGEEKFGGHH